ncbi:MAG: hypothetical protein AAF799_02865 [Myxococcota bacterium]
MADDRTIAPSPGRQRRAWRAGLRPRSAWLLPAVGFGLLAFALRGQVEALLRWWGPGAITPEAWLASASAWLVAGWSVAAVVVVLVAVVTRRLGGISDRDRQRLRAGPARPDVWLRMALRLGLLVGLGMACLGVLAGAARAVDASEAGVFALWSGWAVRASMVIAAGLAAAAVIDLLIDRRDRLLRLFQSRQQRRDDARAGGRAR